MSEVTKDPLETVEKVGEPVEATGERILNCWKDEKSGYPLFMLFSPMKYDTEGETMPEKSELFQKFHDLMGPRPEADLRHPPDAWELLESTAHTKSIGLYWLSHGVRLCFVIHTDTQKVRVMHGSDKHKGLDGIYEYPLNDHGFPGKLSGITVLDPEFSQHWFSEDIKQEEDVYEEHRQKLGENVIPCHYVFVDPKNLMRVWEHQKTSVASVETT